MFGIDLLAAKENFLTKEIAFGKSFALPYYAVLIILVVLATFVALLIFASVKASKKGKRAKAPVEEKIDVRSGPDATEEEIIRNNGNVRSDYVKVSGYVPEEPEEEEEGPAPAVTEEEPVETEALATEETEEEEPVEQVEEEPVEETTEEFVEEMIEEPIEEIQEEEEPKKEDKKPVKTEKKEAPAKKPAPAKAAPAKKEAPAKAAKPAPKAQDNKITGKIEICNSDLGGYNYLLRANNGQLLYESKAYRSIDSTKEAIDNFIEAVKVGMFSIRKDKFGNYKFILKSPTSNNLLYVGESFTTENSCKSNIESVKRFACVSPIVDITEKDFVAKFVRYDIPEKLVKDVEKGALSTGRWSVEKTDENVKNSPFEFLLYANNGQLLFESRDYKTRATCLAGLKTFVNTVKTGYFVIDPDKSGRFKFVLRNNAANSVSEYYGENYDTKKACANNIESVYHFALLSPIPEN